MVSVSAHSAGAYTATLLVMVNVMRGGGRAPPTLTKEIYANRFFRDSHWLEIWKNHLSLSMGPNGGEAMDSVHVIHIASVVEK
jgi:hypothetical protein